MTGIHDVLKNDYQVDEPLLRLCEAVLSDVSPRFAAIDDTAGFNQLKVLRAMQENRLSDAHFAATTGYGYNDIGRDALERIYASVFKAEDALVRPQIISGTHALTVALFGNLRYGDELLSPVGKPYDTLESVIGIKKARGSLMEHGVSYRQAELLPGGAVDYDAVKNSITDNTKIVIIQRSKGYAWRHSLSVDEVKTLISFVKGVKPGVICLVDNCYCEFVDCAEPCEAGAELVVGSLIKNPGGGLAPVGGYIAGKRELVENAAFRLTAPGLGKEVGPTLGVTAALLQGLFMAPSVVAASLKGAVFAAALFEACGLAVNPSSKEKRADIVQAIQMGSAERVVAFCRGVQSAAPVDSFVKPTPAPMPGYDCPVIMAAGAFVQGSSIEFSADAPLKEPFIVYMQGGLTWHHARIGVTLAVNHMVKQGLLTI